MPNNIHIILLPFAAVFTNTHRAELPFLFYSDAFLWQILSRWPLSLSLSLYLCLSLLPLLFALYNLCWSALICVESDVRPRVTRERERAREMQAHTCVTYRLPFVNTQTHFHTAGEGAEPWPTGLSFNPPLANHVLIFSRFLTPPSCLPLCLLVFPISPPPTLPMHTLTHG